MTLRGKEKIWYLVDRLAEEREITPKGSPIGLHPTQDLNKHYSLSDFVNLMTKLENEENAARLTSLPTDQTYMKYQVELLPNFEKYIEKLESDPEYLKFSGKPPKKKGYFDPNARVDLTKSRAENVGKFLTGGQVQEILQMSDDDRDKLLRENLTPKHAQDIEEERVALKELTANFRKSFKSPDLNAVLPPNHAAEQVGLLRRLVISQKAANRPDSHLIAPIYYRDRKQLVFCNRIIDLDKSSDTARLCSLLFHKDKPRKTPIGLGDVLLQWQDPNHKNTKRVRNAVANLNTSIAKKTTITDLLLVKSKQIYFNQDYV